MYICTFEVVVVLKYYNPIVDTYGYTHSIDMVYVEYLLMCDWKYMLDMVRETHGKYPEVSYHEYLDRSPCSKYDFYLNAVAIGGVYFQFGKYRALFTDTGDKFVYKAKSYELLNMCQLRVNPNKHMHEGWFRGLLDKLLYQNGGGYVRKYDYAIDLQVAQKDVQIFDSRKEKGLYKGTRYYGQAGRHGYVKIYNKAKELQKLGVDCPDTLTRVEYTLFNNVMPSLEKVSVCYDDELNNSVVLNDTDRAIVDMYRILVTQGIQYDLNLSRRKEAKLRPFLQGKFRELDYGSCLEHLLDHVKDVFCAHLEELPDVGLNVSSPLPTDADGFVCVDGMEGLPFD